MSRTAAALAVLAAIGGVFALTQLPLPHRSLVTDAILDAGHAPLFAVFTWFAWTRLERSGTRSTVVALGGALVLAAILGGLTELAQVFTARNADAGDLLRDLAGAAAVAALVLAGRGTQQLRPRQRRPARALLSMLLVALIAIPVLPLVDVALAYRHRDASFPVLLDFERDRERVFVRLREAELEFVPRPASGSSSRAGRAARVTFEPADFPAIILQEPRADWSAHEWLEFDVFLGAGEPPDLYLRIDDAIHDETYTDRFNRALALEVGWNAFRIPLAEVRDGPRIRALDLVRVRSLAFFVHPSTERRSLLFDRIRLTGIASTADRSPGGIERANPTPE